MHWVWTGSAVHCNDSWGGFVSAWGAVQVQPGVCTGVRRVSKVQRLKEQLRTLWHAVLMPEILLPAAFIFLWQVAPPASPAYLMHIAAELLKMM